VLRRAMDPTMFETRFFVGIGSTSYHRRHGYPVRRDAAFDLVLSEVRFAIVFG
jgi:hypothetical protein